MVLNEQSPPSGYENVDSWANMPMALMLDREGPHSFTTSFGATSTGVPRENSTSVSQFQPSLGLDYPIDVPAVPYNDFGIDNGIFQEVSAGSDPGTKLNCTPLQGHNLFDGSLYTHSSDVKNPPMIASENAIGSMPAFFDMFSPSTPTADTITSLTSVGSPSQALDYLTSMGMDDFQTDNQRWHATQSRLRAADRVFLYGVLTTKIFCKPSCASRRPSRRHVRYFSFPGAVEAAKDANFRPCKRCIPEDSGIQSSNASKVCEVLRAVIANAFGVPGTQDKRDLKLEPLARLAGLSAFHFHRLFKATTNIALGDFILACRALALQDFLRSHSGSDRQKLAVLLSSDENSFCWTPRAARKALGGISPVEYASGASSKALQYCIAQTPCGPIYVVFSVNNHPGNANVHTVAFGQDGRETPRQHFPTARLSSQHGSRLQRCIDNSQQESSDRDTELPADVLPVLWRVRMLLRFLQ